MKCFLTIILLTISASSAISQKTITLNKQWNTLYYDFFSQSQNTSLYSFQNDTIINSKEYLQLHIKGDTSSSVNWNSLNTFLREDSLNRIYMLENDIEALLYDFQLIEGETFPLNHDDFYCELMVTQVDSVQILTGEHRKRIRLVSTNDPNPTEPWYGFKDWIQGIGSNTSLTRYYGSCFTDYPFDLLCFYEDGDLAYSNPDYQTCLISNISDIIENEEVHIFPNPSNNTIEIKTEAQLLNIDIYNFNGQLIVKSSDSIIGVEHLNPGIYLTHIQTKNGITAKKLLIN